jgi:hypothetical protein
LRGLIVPVGRSTHGGPCIVRHPRVGGDPGVGLAR